MGAQLPLRERHIIRDDAFAELVVWKLPPRSGSSAPTFTYRLALVVGGVCVIRYDNETGRDDHVHRGDVEEPYRFTTAEKLLADFWHEVDVWRS